MKLTALGLLATSLLAGTAHAADINGKDVAVSVGVDYVTQYVFRGASLADDAIQPYVELGFGNLTVGTWFSTGVGEDSRFAADEIDVYASYGFQLSDDISASVGGTYYHYPQGGGFLDTDNGGTGSYEVNAGVSFDNVVLSPAVTAYYDFTLENFTVEGFVGQSLTAGEKSNIDLGVTAGLVDGEDGFSYEYATASLGYGFALTDEAGVSASLNYTLSSEDFLDFTGSRVGAFPFTDSDNLLWAGVGISTSF